MPSSDWQAFVNTPDSIHGSASCVAKKRFYCPVCERWVCWCKGCDTDVDAMVAIKIAHDPKAGVCDDCWWLMRDISHELHDDSDLPDEFLV